MLTDRNGWTRSPTSTIGIFVMSAPSSTSAASWPALTAHVDEVEAGVEERAAVGRAREHGEDRHAIAAARAQ